MSAPKLATTNPLVGVYVVWGVAFVSAVAIGVFVPFEGRTTWFLLAFAILVIAAVAIQLCFARVEGFTTRVAVSAVGALLIMVTISLGFFLASLGQVLP